MFFRNLTFFRLPPGLDVAVDELEARLDGQRLRACGPLELATRGFVSPFGRESEVLAHRQGACALVAVGVEERLLPAVVVNEALAARIAEVRAREDRRIGGRERRRLKEEVVNDLLPRAFVRPARRAAYLDFERGWLVIDTASRKAAEDVVTELREAFGSFPALPPAPEESPRALLTAWLAEGSLPPGLALGEECELRDPAAAGAVVRCRRQELESDEMREHLKAGKQVFQLGLVFEDRIAFVLGEDLVVRKLRFLDVVHEELGEDARESAAAELDATFALMTLELGNLLARMEQWFGLSRDGAEE